MDTTDRRKNHNVYSIQIGINIQQITNHSIITLIICKKYYGMQFNAKKRDERDVRSTTQLSGGKVHVTCLARNNTSRLSRHKNMQRACRGEL